MTMIQRKKYKLIACEVLFREICYCAARCAHIVDVTFMDKGLHNVGTKRMSEKLQGEIDRVDAEKKEKYKAYFEHNPGTFFLSPGWIERNNDPNNTENSIPTQSGLGKTYQEYAELYDEETAKYLFDMLGDWLKHYKKTAFINTQVGNEALYRDIAKQFASEKGWTYEELAGDTGLIYRLLNGDWNCEEFLLLPPDTSVTPSYDENIISAKRAEHI